MTHSKKVPQRAGFLKSCNQLNMDQPTEARSWVQKPQHCQWGFEEPRPELLKIPIDLRLKDYQPTFHPPPARRSGPSLSSMLSHHQQSKASDFSRSESFKIIFTNPQQHLQAGGQQSSGSNVPDLFVHLLPQSHLVSRSTNSRISEKRISDQARFRTKTFAYVERRISKESATDTLEVPSWISPRANGGKRTTPGHVET